MAGAASGGHAGASRLPRAAPVGTASGPAVARCRAAFSSPWQFWVCESSGAGGKAPRPPTRSGRASRPRSPRNTSGRGQRGKSLPAGRRDSGRGKVPGSCTRSLRARPTANRQPADCQLAGLPTLRNYPNIFAGGALAPVGGYRLPPLGQLQSLRAGSCRKPCSWPTGLSQWRRAWRDRPG